MDGIEVPVGAAGIVVSLRDVPTGEIEVAWIDGGVARITAGDGSRYTFADGRAEASVTRGPVLVELPRGMSPVSLEVNGRMVLVRTEAGLELPSGSLSRGPDRIVIMINQR